MVFVRELNAVDDSLFISDVDKGLRFVLRFELIIPNIIFFCSICDSGKGKGKWGIGGGGWKGVEGTLKVRVRGYREEHK